MVNKYILKTEVFQCDKKITTLFLSFSLIFISIIAHKESCLGVLCLQKS